MPWRLRVWACRRACTPGWSHPQETQALRTFSALPALLTGDGLRGHSSATEDQVSVCASSPWGQTVTIMQGRETPTPRRYCAISSRGGRSAPQSTRRRLVFSPGGGVGAGPKTEENTEWVREHLVGISRPRRWSNNGPATHRRSTRRQRHPVGCS